jgi:hypothetical protein
MQATTHHQISVIGNDRLVLTEVDGSGEHIVIARRQDGVWYITADGVPDGSTTDVHEALEKMTEHALQVKKNELGPKEFAKLMESHGHSNEGFSTWVPHAARQLDGEASFKAWQAKHGLQLK